jgi:RimJ/RimL family protein N-acetyltransferase
MVRFEHVASDGTELVFREPVKGEAKALMSFINSFVDEPMSGLLIDKKVSLRGEEKWLESRLGEIRSRSVVMLLAERDGRVVGSCHMSRLPWKHSHRADIGVALKHDVRGKGVGEALMRRTMELGIRRFRGLETVELSAFAYNDRALALYKKLGFEECARIPRSAKEGRTYFDEVLMRLDLPSVSRGRKSMRGR